MCEESIMDIKKSVNQQDSQEKKALKELRKILTNIDTEDITDATLLKYLRAKNFNITSAGRMFREYMNFKTALQLNNIDKLWIKLEELQNYEFVGELGFAKDETPIRYTAMGRGDFLGFMLSLDVYDIGRFCASYIEKDLEKCKEQSKKLGKEINEITYILDMEGFTSRQVFSSEIVELGLDLFRIFQDYYPEVWKRVLIVNAPHYFSIAFNVFKPILKRNLMQNIHVVSKGDTPQLLFKHVDVKVLPAFLGGQRVDSKGNPTCSEFIKFGGRVPEKYFLRNCLPLLSATDPGVEDKLLSPKHCHNHSVIVPKARSIVRIEYRTEGGSIITSILYREFGSNPHKIDLPSSDEYLDEHKAKCNVQLILPVVHAQSHKVPTDNQFLALLPGIYILKFDNSHNWLSSRRVIYRITVLPPKA